MKTYDCLNMYDYDHGDGNCAVRSLVLKNKIEPGLVYVFWTNGERPLLKIHLSDFIEYADDIFAEDWDAWIFSSDEGWCIENHHDGELCFYRS